jgi:thiamine pyrophosphokinase
MQLRKDLRVFNLNRLKIRVLRRTNNLVCISGKSVSHTYTNTMQLTKYNNAESGVNMIGTTTTILLDMIYNKNRTKYTYLNMEWSIYLLSNKS